MKSLLRKTGGIVFCILLLGLTALAQTTGSISGTINDPNGAPIVGATVIVKSETGSEFTSVTSDNGTYIVPALNAGNYTVSVTAPGFKKTVVSKVKVDVSKPSTVSIALEVGSPEAEVNVAASGAELINTQTATVGTTITGRQITELPLASRDALDLVTTLPGVATVGRPRQSSVNGLPKGAIKISIDGIDAQDNLLRSSDGFFTFIRPRIDAVDEVTVSTATPGAESSGDGAVQIKFVTRGGTNEYSGSAYWYHRNPALNANYFFNNRDLAPDPRTGKAPHNRILLNQPGARFGGPITIPGLFNGKDKAFFFVNYEEFRLPEQQARTRIILTPQAQAGNYTYGATTRNVLTLAANTDCDTVTAGLQPCPSTVDPTVGSLLAAIRTSTAQGSVTANTDPNIQNFNFINVGGNVRRFPTVRLDFNLTKNHHLENIWNYQDFNNVSDFLNNVDPRFPGFPAVSFQDSIRWSNAIALRSTFKNNLVNELRLALVGGVSHFRDTLTRSTFSNQGGFSLGIGAALGITTATASNTTNRRNSPTKELTDNMTYVWGAHSLNFGGGFKQIELFNQGLGEVAPVVTFGIDATDPASAIFTTANFPGASTAQLNQALGLYATLIGRVTAVSGTGFLDENGRYVFDGNQTQRARQRVFSLYGQDSWRFRPNLTLNYGLRWEVQQPFEVRSTGYSFAPFSDLFGISGLGNINRPGVLQGRNPQFTEVPIGEKAYDTHYNDFAPSVGFAWSPNFEKGFLRTAFGESGQTVIRGGGSIAFVREGTNAILSITGSNPGGTVAANRSVALGNLAVGTMLSNTAALNPPAFPTSPTFPIAATEADAVNVFDPSLRSGYVASWTLGVQREITKNTVFEARYVGNRGIRLWRQYNINETNVLENGFINEFRLAQQNLLANNAAGGTRAGSFAYFGVGTGTSPLPSSFAYIRGAGDSTNAALYNSTLWRNATLVGNLSPLAPVPQTFAANIFGSAARRANAAAAGLPPNFFVTNPNTLGGAFVIDNGGRSSYDALQLELRRSLTNGLLVSANYTFSKSLTDIYAVSAVVFSAYPTMRDPRSAKTNSAFDVTHQFKLNYIYELPFGKGKTFFGNANGLVDKLVGGWEFHGVTRLQSGTPFNLGNVQLVGMTREELQDAVQIRKDPNRIVYFLPDDIIQNTIRAFNIGGTAPTGRFIAPAGYGNCIQAYAGQCGISNLILKGPAFLRWDASIVKKIRFTERTNLELRAEFLNAPNNVSFRVGGWTADAPTVTNFANQAFGQLGNGTAYQDTSTTNDPGGRLVQIVIRINF